VENQLKNLKKSMDKTIFMSGNLSSIEKKRILTTVLHGEVQRKKNYFASIMSSILIAGFSIVIGNFIIQNMFDSNSLGNQHPVSTVKIAETHKNEQMTQVKSVKQIENSEQSTSKDEQPTYPYLIFNGYYYKKTNKEIPTDQLGTQIGRVERTGDWAIRKSGDSNEVPPGPIYSVNGKTKDFVAAKGVAFKNGNNISAYLVFQKADKVIEPNIDLIINSKGDQQENHIAFENIKNKIGTLYGFVGINSKAKLQSISYNDGPIVQLSYRATEGDFQSEQGLIQGTLLINQHGKEFKPKDSRFERPVVLEKVKKKDGSIAFMQKKEMSWKKPVKIEDFSLNGINWELYQDSFHKDLVLKGETEQYTIEITTEGQFNKDQLKDLLESYKKVE
jgi:hypothetical protein